MIPYRHDDFIDYLRYEKRASMHTVHAYQNDLSQFFQFCQEHLAIPSLDVVTGSDIRTWIISLLEDEGLSVRSVNRKISAIRALYHYKLKIGVLKDNPLNQIQAPKFKQSLPEYVEEKDIDLLFSEELFSNDFSGLRDRLIIELFYATGIRESELLGIRHHDIDFQEKQIKVLGKRNKERLIPFGPRMDALLTSYMEYYEKRYEPGNENYYIFVTGKGEELYPKAVYRIVRKYLDMVTTIKKRSPHVIRHTFATHLLNKGADLNAIKEILGHSSLAATQIYTHNSMEKLKSIYKQAHPRA